ncbi:MAG: UDP-3-O-(3-hydroxymyristoyl)glucosamine N-acyltransferase [Deltaproteobacteria bacterium]|nr:UDP-3-O-(3-hydroxymyristoyl)glucosamine N-acyltransferase [Deltaproteobacteria bacterium]
MEISLQQLASMVNGRLEGPPEAIVVGIAGIKEAKSDQITFLANPKYEAFMADTQAGGIIVERHWAGTCSRPLIRVDNPYLAFARASQFFHKKTLAPLGVSPQAWVDDSARIGNDVSIYPFAYVGSGARIGDRAVLHPFSYVGSEGIVGEDTLLHANVSVLERCSVGCRVTIHSGTVVGSDGFGYARDGDEYVKIPQAGIVQIDDDVEIGANCAIDRATTGKTWIQKGVKIDNLVQVAHNVVVGMNTILVAQSGISGSTEIGNNVQIGGQVGIVGHVRIGDRVGIAAQSGVTRSIEDGSIVSGTPALPHHNSLRAVALIPKLPNLFKRIQNLEARLKQLEDGPSGG